MNFNSLNLSLRTLIFPQEFSSPRRLAAVLRGLGSEAPQRGFRGTGTSPHACLHSKNYNPQQYSKLKPQGDQTMYLPYSAIQHLRREKTTILPTKILTVILLGTLTACASGQYRKKTLVKILDQQETVIESLKTERSESEIAQKLKKIQNFHAPKNT